MLIISNPFHYYLSSICFFLFGLVYCLRWISNSNHWPLFIFLWYHLISLCYMSDHYVWFNVACTHMFTENTNYTMVYCISLCQMQWLTHTHTHTHILLKTLLQPCCISHHYDKFNDECTYMFYWWHYLHHVVCQITMSDVMMNVHTCLTDSITYIILYVRSLCEM